MYISEMVVNIKELEDYISGAFAMVLCIQKELQNESPDFQSLKSFSDSAVEKLQMAYTGSAGVISVMAAWLFARLGILLYVIITLAVMMCIEYLSGMMASKYEAIDHPDDPNFGRSSKKGAKGILKKVGYICVIAVAIVVDYIIMQVAETAGIEIKIKAIFGLIVTVWGRRKPLPGHRRGGDCKGDLQGNLPSCPPSIRAGSVSRGPSPHKRGVPCLCRWDRP